MDRSFRCPKANQVIPRLNGDDYQHLYSGTTFSLCFDPKDQVSRVRVEDADAGSVDDVTVYHELNSGLPEEFYHFFYQVKYHENQEHHYSTEKLFQRKENGRSLLQKFFETWRSLREQHPGQRIELYLVSNWSWNQDTDKIGRCINQQEGKLGDEFFSSGPKSDVGQVRDSWREHVRATPEDFESFVRSLNLHLGVGPFREIERLVSDRMEHLGLKNDANAVTISIGVIRDGFEQNRAISQSTFWSACLENGIYAPQSAERCVTIHMNTIGERMFDLSPDYVLDWRRYFEGQPGLKGHQLKNPANWDKKLLPELRALLEEVRSTTSCTLVRARGLARLSAWLAFGFTFSEVAGYVVEVEQQGHHWRTNVAPSEDFDVVVSNKDGAPDGEAITGSGTTVACGISVTGSLDEDVRRHLSAIEDQSVAALLLLRPRRELGRHCLRGAPDAVALARDVKELLRRFVKRWGATRVLVYYFGPLSGACFIGHQLNAVCREIYLMEDQQPGYSPSFILGG